ncbi:MAG: S46 family peptidase [Bacteroidales bacterium]
MKKTKLLVIALLVLLVSPVRADEGMWLLPLIEKMNGKALAEKGFTLTPEEIYNINHSSLKDAIVQFGGGCTGEIVSKNGLIFTNHHCGYSYIQALSSVEHNYLKDGYWAMNNSEELRAKGLYVKFLDSMTDVTKQINDACKDAKNDSERDSIISVVSNRLVKNAVGGRKHLEGTVTDFYSGNAYYLILTKTFYDIRFVGTPPSSIGKFGGDTDNWMWPRHTGDFSVFRVYADVNNEPAKYSKENLPYNPDKFLTVSLKGYQKGDPAMILGYPGRTNRFMTVSELKEQRDISNAISIKMRGIRQDILMKDMRSNPKIMIQYASKYAGSSNGWKKWIGMNKTFKTLNIEEHNLEDEAIFKSWVNKTKSRRKKYGDALDLVNAGVAKKDSIFPYLLYLMEGPAKIELSTFAFQTALSLQQDSLNTLKSVDKFYKDYSVSTDRKVAKAMLKAYKENVDSTMRINIFNRIDTAYNGSIDKYVDYIFDNSVFTSKEKLVQYLSNHTAFSIEKDPACQIMSSIMHFYPRLLTTYRSASKDIQDGKKKYIAGILQMKKGKAVYPDANFTMRMTYGSVLPYSPRDAVFYNYYTTLDGVMQKEDPNNWEFEVPDKLKELWKNKDFEQYAMPSGEMPCCFLTNNDITGGNSGSPVLNGAGELIGLAFDGNWESMSSDVLFNPNLQRCICVDVRYVLFIIDKFGGAGYLLDEMNINK